MDKLSVLMPTFNDEKTIKRSIDSVLNQTYKNIELIIINDGSSDKTVDVINSFNDKRIRLLNQSNKDQLNALINGYSYSTGDVIYILHSDDLFFDNKVVENAMSELAINKDYGALKGHLVAIDDKDEYIQKIRPRKSEGKKDDLLNRMFLLYGTNILNDFAFIRKDEFEKISFKNYLYWNTPFWIDFTKENLEVIKIKNIDLPIIKYRIHEENYINNEIGKLNVINGNLRSIMHLMRFYDIPFYSFQRFLSRIFKDKYKPIFFKKETKRKSKIVTKVIKGKLKSTDNIYIKSLENFYIKNDYFRKNKIIKEVRLLKYASKIKFFGKDMRLFNNIIVSENIPKEYNELFELMNMGFNRVICDNELEYQEVERLLIFLNLRYSVEIVVKNNYEF
ncbi:glycosyltransferase [Exiguobacterium sp. s91]|uniref:glycosyltransferase n=1 Tax=Exiguobacterium sp. s91 TaxID=2751199 RepID=UPI001BED292E|nr:glycosyltransferase [Exiguobacterium sp. s91]